MNLYRAGFTDGRHEWFQMENGDLAVDHARQLAMDLETEVLQTRYVRTLKPDERWSEDLEERAFPSAWKYETRLQQERSV